MINFNDISNETLLALVNLEGELSKERIQQELDARSQKRIDRLVILENKYFIKKSTDRVTVYKTDKWIKDWGGNFGMVVLTIEIGWSNGNDPQHFTVSKGNHHWYENNCNYYKSILKEITKDEFENWESKYEAIYDTCVSLNKLKEPYSIL